MARQLGWALVALMIVGNSMGAVSRQAETVPVPPASQQQPQRSASPEGRHRGPWWKAPHPAAAELALTSEQSAAIDKIFWAYVEKAKPLRAHVNDLDAALDKAMRASTTDTAAIERDSAKIERKRAELNTMRTVMLYSIRRVLNPEQNTKFQKYQDRVEEERRKQDASRRR